MGNGQESLAPKPSGVQTGSGGQVVRQPAAVLEGRDLGA